MSGEEWDFMREQEKERKAKRRSFNTGGIFWMAGELELEVEEITPYQLRVTKGKKRLDYFPTSGKATWVGTNKYFKIKNLDEFMEKHFK